MQSALLWLQLVDDDNDAAMRFDGAIVDQEDAAGVFEYFHVSLEELELLVICWTLPQNDPVLQLSH